MFSVVYSLCVSESSSFSWMFSGSCCLCVIWSGSLSNMCSFMLSLSCRGSVGGS